MEKQAFKFINQWVSAIRLDRSSRSQREKVIADKPRQLVDGCWTKGVPAQFLAERQTFGREPNTRCNALWPSYAFPRFVAGGALSANVLKCELKPIDREDYSVSFTSAELRQLEAIFPAGACDWSKPAIYFSRIEVGRSYGPAPKAFRPPNRKSDLNVVGEQHAKSR